METKADEHRHIIRCRPR